MLFYLEGAAVVGIGVIAVAEYIRISIIMHRKNLAHRIAKIENGNKARFNHLMDVATFEGSAR